MNKVLSQAIKKAVSEFSPTTNYESNVEKRPDLFSLNNETELFQNEKGITIKIDRSRDSKLTEFGKATLSDRYLVPMSHSKICLQELLVTMLMTIYMLKDYIIILATFGSCRQHQFYLMGKLKEDCQFLVF